MVVVVVGEVTQWTSDLSRFAAQIYGIIAAADADGDVFEC